MQKLSNSTEARETAPTEEGAAAGNDRFAVRLNATRQEADDIRSFEFVDPGGRDLPPFTAGAHLHVHLEGDISRQYSLCNDPAERHRYVVAVLREENGRGGSRLMHDSLEEGQEVWISGPENHFPLAERGVNFHLLLAGGIGVTPMMAMIEELDRRGQDYLMHYCTRSKGRTAFLERLAPRIEKGKVVLHHDGGDPARGLDIEAALAEHSIGMHLYACGPAGFLRAVNSSVGAWPPHAVHQEYFSAREMTEEEKAWDARPFQVKIASTGAVLDIPAGRSIVDVLRDHGINVQTDCQEGYCGTCITHYVDGDPVHRDTVLNDSDREDYVMLCCARSRSDLLVLDL